MCPPFWFLAPPSRFWPHCCYILVTGLVVRLNWVAKWVAAWKRLKITGLEVLRIFTRKILLSQWNIRDVCRCHASIKLFWLRKILIVLFVTKQYQPQWGQSVFVPPPWKLGLRTKNVRKSEVSISIPINLMLAITLYLLVWHSHCTKARFTVLVWCSDELAVHSFPLLRLQTHVVKLASSSGHRLIWWGGCDVNLQWTQRFTGPYCVNQSLSHTYIYEETSLSSFKKKLEWYNWSNFNWHITTIWWRGHRRRLRYIEDSR